MVGGELVRVGDTVKSKGEIHACESIFLGKKSYIDRVRDDEGNHIRLKGIQCAECGMKNLNPSTHTVYQVDASPPPHSAPRSSPTPWP